jgi:hypothetical protein
MSHHLCSSVHSFLLMEYTAFVTDVGHAINHVENGTEGIDRAWIQKRIRDLNFFRFEIRFFLLLGSIYNGFDKSPATKTNLRDWPLLLKQNCCYLLHFASAALARAIRFSGPTGNRKSYFRVIRLCSLYSRFSNHHRNQSHFRKTHVNVTHVNKVGYNFLKAATRYRSHQPPRFF